MTQEEQKEVTVTEIREDIVNICFRSTNFYLSKFYLIFIIIRSKQQ